MNPKHGILHDYDLHANQEPSARLKECIVCEVYPMVFQWSDYSGEAMCTSCGTPYQLKWGSEGQQREGKYPYLKLKDSFIEAVRTYHRETGRFTCLGTMIGRKPGLKEFYDWLKENRPNLLEPEAKEA